MFQHPTVSRIPRHSSAATPVPRRSGTRTSTTESTAEANWRGSVPECAARRRGKRRVLSRPGIGGKAYGGGGLCHEYLLKRLHGVRVEVWGRGLIRARELTAVEPETSFDAENSTLTIEGSPKLEPALFDNCQMLSFLTSCLLLSKVSFLHPFFLYVGCRRGIWYLRLRCFGA